MQRIIVNRAARVTNTDTDNNARLLSLGRTVDMYSVACFLLLLLFRSQFTHLKKNRRDILSNQRKNTPTNES